MGWKYISKSAAVVIVALFVLSFSAAPANAEAVDRIVSDLVLGTSDGPPTCAVDANGVLHVVYSRNDRDSEETRADIYYVQVDLNAATLAPSHEVCLTQGLGTWTGDLSDADPLKDPKNTSFHMSPRITVDSTGRVHVLFAGFGDLSEGYYYTVSVRYNTQLAYLDFKPAAVLAWDGVGECPLDTCTVIVPNDYESSLDEVQIASPNGYYTGLEYCRMNPNLTLEETTDNDGQVQVLIHAGFGSASGYSEVLERNSFIRISYARFAVGTSGIVVDGSLKLTHVDHANLDWYRARAGLFSSGPRVAAYPVGDGRVQVIASFAKAEDGGDLWGHYLFDPEVDGTPHAIYGALAKDTFSRPSAALDGDGRLHVAGATLNGAELVFPYPSGTTHEQPVLLPGSFDGPGNFFRGGMVVNGTFYRLTDNADLEFLEQVEGADPIFHRYTTALYGESGDGCDLVSGSVGGQTLFAGVYVHGCNGVQFMSNYDGFFVPNNLRLTVFREPDPATDVEAWITYPQDGQAIYLPKKAKGKITLSALDGAPGTETYKWLEGTKVLGTGQSLTAAFADGSHDIELEVTRGVYKDSEFITFSVQTYNGSTPPTSAGISVSQTSGLVTTEGGGFDTFTVVLDTQPTADVTIALSSSDIGEGTVSPGLLTFTTLNWSTAQTVTVTGVDDASLEDGDVTYTVLLAAAVSSDSNYSGLDAADVSATNEDGDAPTETTSPSVEVSTDIPDKGSLTSRLSVDATGLIVSLTVTIETIHERVSDLTVTLESPRGTSETLSGANGTYTTSSFVGEGLSGDWILVVADGKKKKTGSLESWGLTVVFTQ